MKLPVRYEPTGKAYPAGGMSTAIVCRDKHLDRDVLIKALQKGVDQKRITDEIAALSSIRSKHVVEIYDVIRDDKATAVALVEELITGDDLDTQLPVKDEKTFLRHAYAIASGLADIHAVSRVHRDIKPNNMKFDSEGTLRIFDFGLSRDESEASTTGTVGTIGYLAPELCVGPKDQASFTPAIDTFAFGSTALKMIRGKIPSDLRKVPPSLPCEDADFTKQKIALPEDIAGILNACLSKKPKDRPTMASVRDAIGSYLVHGRHKATIVANSNVYTLDKSNRKVKLSGSGSSAAIEYDGIHFIITEATGAVSVNRIPCKTPHQLPESCVLIFGDDAQGRSFASVDISYPEVVV